MDNNIIIQDLEELFSEYEDVSSIRQASEVMLTNDDGLVITHETGKRFLITVQEIRSL